ncbi:MAG: lysophospholipid acyltransferase family protein [Caulobacter sp.]|nr:lysophospholipid acyltransferase family protein [Caulobacter sp.]
MSKPRPSGLQGLVWRFEAVGFDLLTAICRLFPVDVISDFGGAAARLIGPLTSTHRTARENLMLAFPDMDEAERQRLLTAQWDNTGRTMFEFPLMDRILPSTGRVEMVNAERLAEISRDREAVVFVSGHLSNWEVMPAAIVDQGVDCLMTYRAANNPYVDKRIRDARYRYGVRLFAPKGGEGAKELLEALGNGQSVALMNDQKFNAGLPVPFFGHPAMTAPGPTRLALRFGTVLQPMSVERLKGARFRVIVHPPIAVERTGDRAADIEAGVRKVNAFLEDCVRKRPEEWFWVHRRWPNETYAALRASQRAAADQPEKVQTS